MTPCETATEEFIRTTDDAYQECSQGIYALDRITVNVSENFTAQTRSYLIPMIYAYWERFFRIAFSEFVRCLSLRSDSHLSLNERLGRFALRRHLRSKMQRYRIKDLRELPTVAGVEGARSFFSALSSWFDDYFSCDAPSEWINTRANVGFDVLQENCNNLGIDFQRIVKALEESGHRVFRDLDSLLKDRNSIAHGESFQAVSRVDWETHKNFVLDLMNCVQLTLHATLSQECALLRNDVDATAASL